MNLRLRLKNKATLMALAVCAVAIGYEILGIMGLTVPVTETGMVHLISLVLNGMVALGVLVDPTTCGVKDSCEVMKYNQPKESIE
ncbi:MAG: phage holin [Anaerovoracaceae bacterium]